MTDSIPARRASSTGFARRARLAVAGIGLALAASVPVLAQQGEQGTLANIISWALSTPGNRVSVGAVDGALSSVATIRDIKVSDRRGVWLSVDQARIDWSRLALFNRRLDVNTLEIGRMEIARRPEAEEAAAASAAEAPALPELPVKVIVRSFQLKELVLGEPVIGTAARIGASGSTVLGAPSEGLSLNFQANRLDAAGRFGAVLAYVPQSGQLDLSVQLDEPSGGLLSRTAGLAGEPPIRLALEGKGPIDRWAATLDFRSGPDVDASGRATIVREGAGRRVGLDLGARIAPLLPEPIQPIFADSTALVGDVLVGDDLGLAIRRLDLTSRAGRLALSGTLDAARKANLRLNLAALPTDGAVTRAGDVSIGRLSLDAVATGDIAMPSLSATLAIADVVSPGLRIGAVNGRLAIAPPAAGGDRPLSFALTGSGLRPADRAIARALGDRLSMTADGSVTPDFVLVTPAARLETTTATATWAGRVGPRVARGRAEAALADLSVLSDLVGRPLKGRARLAADIEGDPGRYRVAAKLDGGVDALSLGVAPLDRVLAGRLALTGTVNRLPGGVGFEGFRLAGGHATLALDGPATSDAANLTASLDIPDLRRADTRLSGALAVRALLAGSLMQPDVDATAAVRGWAGGGAEPRVALKGRLGERIDIAATLQAIPLALSALVAPDLGLAGTLEGSLTAAGDPAAPEGAYRIVATRVTARPAAQAGLQPAEVRAEGRLSGGRATVDASLAVPKVGTLRATGSAPLRDGALDLAVRGPVDIAVANAFLAAGGRQVSGQLALDLRVSGQTSAPKLGGSATLARGTFYDPVVGIRLDGISGRFVAQGDTVVVEALSAATRNGGKITVAGRVSTDVAAGLPADLRITGSRAQVLSSDVITATADIAMTVSGPLARGPRIAGRIDLIATEIAIPDRLPVQLQPLPGTRHIKPGPAARARLREAQQVAREQQRGGRPFVATLDLTVNARNRIFVRGRGVQAELSGDVRVTGTSESPVVFGGFDLRRGDITLAGQRITFVRGKVAFTGDLEPTLDFLAQTQAAEVTAQIAVTGRAAEPRFVISSQPPLPQDEVISRLLFDRATGGLNGLQALQLAQTIAQLSGNGGPDAFDQLRKALGVDSLDVSAGASGGPTVGVGKYINRNVRLGVKAGATPADTGATVDVDVSRRMRLRGQLGADGAASVGAAVEWEY
ncbi:MAG: translocation/assembly module TamB domain-containing protein [Burkholderiales bacterium]|nr:translocation/assembly module TamB domain-containing protein [Burkholderiales bacterium]